MRIALVNSSRRKLGGIETYLENVIPELLSAGHQLAFWCETDEPTDRGEIGLRNQIANWCVAELGAGTALDELRKWKPDILYAHGLLDSELEGSLLKTAPSVFFAHAYYGTCISGSKAWSNHTVRPCNRAFGPLCLLHYFPHRCGGLNPITMVKEYRRQQSRLELLRRYRCVLTGSEHMRAEFEKHGLRVRKVPLFVSPSVESKSEFVLSSQWRLLFVGRMERLKGGLALVEAIPKIREALGRPVHVTFAGHGPERRLWESKAAHIQASYSGVSFDFPGWVSRDACRKLFAGSDLLVMPSLWPEPFGLVGPEAGLFGVPAVAFRVGGISDWLQDGVNGHFAVAGRSPAASLAEAVIKCLGDSSSYLRLREGAFTMARRFNAQQHVRNLVTELEQAVAS